MKTSSLASTAADEEALLNASGHPPRQNIGRASYPAAECLMLWQVEAKEIQWSEARQWPKELQLSTRLRG